MNWLQRLWCNLCHRAHHYRVVVSRHGISWACRRCDRDWWEDTP